MNFSGHDYLKNMVHLPFFLQNSGLRKVNLAQKSSQSHRKSVTNQLDESGLVHSVRQLLFLFEYCIKYIFNLRLQHDDYLMSLLP